jgi:hypothetical protein
MTSLNNLEKIKRELKKVATETNTSVRQMKIATLISDALKSVGISPVLVGGAAVAFYTNNHYTTLDIDMVAPTTDSLARVMTELGFKKIGKDFVHSIFDIYVEFPSSSLGYTEQTETIKYDNRSLQIISVSDLIVDRLCAFKFWKSEIDGVNAMILLELGKDDRSRTETRVREEDVLDAFDFVLKVYQTVIRKKLTFNEASHLLKAYFSKK